MKQTITYLITLFLLLIVSCNISQEYTFNKDMSGTSNLEIDMSQLIDYMSNIDSSNSFNKIKSIDTLDKSFEKIAAKFIENGATNVKYGWKKDKTVLFISYNFKDISILNKMLDLNETGKLFRGRMGTDSTLKNPKFIKKGKRKLSYIAPRNTNDSVFKKADIESMKDYYGYKLKFNFPTKVKALKSEFAKLSPDKKSIEFSGSLFDIYSTDYSMNFEVKLKRW